MNTLITEPSPSLANPYNHPRVARACAEASECVRNNLRAKARRIALARREPDPDLVELEIRQAYDDELDILFLDPSWWEGEKDLADDPAVTAAMLPEIDCAIAHSRDASVPLLVAAYKARASLSESALRSMNCVDFDEAFIRENAEALSEFGVDVEEYLAWRATRCREAC